MGGSTLGAALAGSPVNTAIIAGCSVAYFLHWNARGTPEHIAISYETVVTERQWYRLITSAFMHLSWMHLFFNMSSLYSVGLAERLFGSVFYTQTTLLLLALTPAVMLGLIHAVNALGRWEARREGGGQDGALPPPGGGDAGEATPLRAWGASLRRRSAAGYSGVLFGWMVVLSSIVPGAAISLPGLAIPAALAPWVMLLVTQCLIPNASFLGHLSGLLAGYTVSWGWWAWVTPYWLWSSTCVAALLLLASVGNNSALAVAPSAWPSTPLCARPPPGVGACGAVGRFASGLAARAAYVAAGGCIRTSPAFRARVGLARGDAPRPPPSAGRYVAGGRLHAWADASSGGAPPVTVEPAPDMVVSSFAGVSSSSGEAPAAAASSRWGALRGAAAAGWAAAAARGREALARLRSGGGGGGNAPTVSAGGRRRGRWTAVPSADNGDDDAEPEGDGDGANATPSSSTAPRLP